MRIQDYLNTTHGAPPPTYNPEPFTTNFPVVGDILMSPSTHFEDTWSLLLCDGGVFDELLYPQLFTYLGVNTTPNMTNLAIEYRIVGDYNA